MFGSRGMNKKTLSSGKSDRIHSMNIDTDDKLMG